MLTIGCHLSSAKGFLAMGRDAVLLSANTFQFFLRNPRGGRAKAIEPNDAEALRAFMAEKGITTCLAHAPYTLNPCSADEHTREFAALVLTDDLKRLSQLPCKLYNMHPGSHVGQGVEVGVQRTAELVKTALLENPQATILLETMAGQGSEIGATFEQLRDILERIGDPRIGVCLDTCHVFAAGYDLKNDLDGVICDFDRCIGLERLRFVHLNDSKFLCGSHQDRHEQLGKGELGWDAIGRIVMHAALQHIPFCLETPHDTLEGYREEIRAVHALADA